MKSERKGAAAGHESSYADGAKRAAYADGANTGTHGTVHAAQRRGLGTDPYVPAFAHASVFAHTWYEFFAGGGMARLGLGPRWRCVFANEWCPKKAAAYRARFGGEELKVADVATLSTRDLPGRADLAWASFPCQDLSLAGAGAGLRGRRSGTFHAFWDLIDGLESEGRAPRIVVLENVVGLMSSHGGRDFAEILRRMEAAGYSCGHLVIDAENFVPQSRPRLFVIGVASATGGPLRLAPEPPVPRTLTLRDVIEDGVRWDPSEHTRYLLSLMSPAHRQRVAEAAPGSIGTIYRRTRADGQRAEVRFDGVAGCLRTPAGGSSRQTILVVDGKRIRTRLLTAREAARLMGVPDDYPLPARYNDAYHLFGDGVAVPVVRYLEERILRPLAESGAPSS